MTEKPKRRDVMCGAPTEDDVLVFIPKLRALGVMQFSGGGISFALGPLPSDPGAAPARDARQQPQDALDVAMSLRGTRPDEGKKDGE